MVAYLLLDRVNVNAPVRIILSLAENNKNQTIVRSRKENRENNQGSELSIHKQENCRRHHNSTVQTTVNKLNQQCVVYEFKCELCDADYVGYTADTFLMQ